MCLKIAIETKITTIINKEEIKFQNKNYQNNE